MKNPVLIKFELTAETRVEIYMRVVEEPALPTPGEAEISREPSVTEFHEIACRLKGMDRLSLEEVNWPVRNSQEVASAIASEILTPFGGEECERVQLMKKQPDGSERKQGGRIKISLIEVITKHLP